MKNNLDLSTRSLSFVDSIRIIMNYTYISFFPLEYRCSPIVVNSAPSRVVSTGVRTNVERVQCVDTGNNKRCEH